MTKITLLKPFLLLALFFVANNVFAQFTQYTTTSTQQPIYMRFDTKVEGRVYMTNDREYPQIFISEDFGETWRLLFTLADPELPEDNPSAAEFRENVRVINGKISVLVRNAWNSTDSGVYTIDPETGEVKHIIPPNLNKGAYIMDWDYSLQDPNVMLLLTQFAATDGSSLVASEVYYTTNGGTTWDLIYDYMDYDEVQINRVKINPHNHNRLMLSRGSGMLGIRGGFLVSEDAGETWAQSLVGNILECIAVNPFDSNEILTGTAVYALNEALFRSRDGGYTWEELPFNWQWYIMDNFWDIQYDPNDPNKIIVIEENQIIITRDGFNTYEDVEVNLGSNYDAPISVSINPFNGEEVYIDIDGRFSTFSTNSGATRTRVNAKQTSYGCSSISFGERNGILYQHYILGDRRYLVNMDTNASTNYNANGCDRIIADPARGDRAFLYNSSTETLYLADENNTQYEISGGIYPDLIIAADPNNSDMYWISTNGLLALVDLSSPSNPDMMMNFPPDWGQIVTGLYASESNEVYLTQSNKLHISTNNGNSWSTKSTLPVNDDIIVFEVNPLNNNDMIIGAGDKIYRSTDKGSTWTKILSGYPVDKIAYSTVESGIIAAGIYTSGLYTGNTKDVDIIYSSNDGESWSTIGSKALHNNHTQSMDFYFGDGGYIDAYIASSDMGRLRYRIAYQCSEGTIDIFPYEETFENGGMPLCWTQDMINGSTTWQIAAKTTGTPDNTPDNSAQKLRFAQTNDTQTTTKLIMKKLDLSSIESPRLTFQHTQVASESNGLRIYYKTSQSESWIELASYSGNVEEWTERKIMLPEQSVDYWIAFEADADSNIDIQIDNVAIRKHLMKPCNPAQYLTINVSNIYGCQVELSWGAPQTNFNAVYNIYRDDVLVAENIEETSFIDDNFPEGEHAWTVKVVCEEGESEGISVTGACNGSCLPPQNLIISSANAIYGVDIITLTWELPEGYHSGLFNIYRDNELIESEITETTYADDQASEGEHIWSVTAICDGKETARVSEIFVCENQCAPARDLQITYDKTEETVTLEWGTPGDLPSGWIGYGEEPVNGISDQASSPNQYSVAVRWTVEELKAMELDGAQLTKIAFVPMTENATYYPCVWIGGRDNNEGFCVARVSIPGVNVIPGEWNTVVLPNPVDIIASQELWIGCEVKYSGDITIGCDNGPVAVDGKSNLIKVRNNNWRRLTQVDEAYSYNLCIGGFIVDANNKSLGLNKSSRPGIASYEIYRNGELLDTTIETTYSESGLDEGTYEYCVIAIYGNDCKAEAVCQSVLVGNPCLAPENVTATLSSGWPACEVTIEWDDAAPMYEPTQIFYESFDEGMPSDWIYLDKDNDGYNWQSSNESYYNIKPHLYKGACALSLCSYMNEDWEYLDFLPDNWMVTPAIMLTGEATLTYHIAQMYGYSYDTYYEVLISSTGTNYDDFTVIHNETLLCTESLDIWFAREIDLSAYSGTIYLAFRHKNDGEGDQVIGLEIDEVSVTEMAPQSRLYNVYRDGEIIVSDVEGTSFIDNDFSEGTHEWSVTTICDEYGHESEHVSASATCDPSRIDNVNTGDFSAYPNPTSGHITIENTDEIIDNIQILDISGNTMQVYNAINANKADIDISRFAPGVYFIKINNQISKIIKK